MYHRKKFVVEPGAKVRLSNGGFDLHARLISLESWIVIVVSHVVRLSVT